VIKFFDILGSKSCNTEIIFSNGIHVNFYLRVTKFKFFKAN
jgi:hypothetical protein